MFVPSSGPNLHVAPQVLLERGVDHLALRFVLILPNTRHCLFEQFWVMRVGTEGKNST